MTPYLEYNFEGTQDAITLAHIVDMASAIPIADAHIVMNPNPAWSSCKGHYMVTGHRMHGDSVTTSWANSLTYNGLSSDPDIDDPVNGVLHRYWNALNAWGVIWVGVDNTTTNAFVSIFDTQIYTLSIATGLWSRIDNSNGRPAFAFSYWDLDDYQLYGAITPTFDPVKSRQGWSNVPTVGDRSAPIAGSAPTYSKYKIAHNSLLPMQEVDGSDVGGIFVTAKAKMFTAGGEAFNGTTKLFFQVGSDTKPELTSTLGAANTELEGATYYLGVGGGKLVEMPTDGSEVRVSMCTVGGDGFSGYVGTSTESPYGALNPVYLSYDEISANLPVLKFNDHPTFENGYFTEYSDVSYGADSEHLLDVYGTGGSNRKTIVMVHGGFWVAGDKANTNVVRNKVTYWGSRGYAVVSINYRRNGIPANQVLDIEAALDFLKANAATYGIDTTKIILMGHSSGGHIATLFAITRPTEIAGAVILDSAVMDMDDTMNNTHIAAFDTIFGASQAYWNANSPKYQFTDYNEPDIPLTHTMIVSSTISAQMTAQNSAFATLASATLLASGYNHEDTNANLGLYGDAYTVAVANFIETLV